MVEREEPPPPLVAGLAEVKAYLRITGTEEDALLAGLVRSATGLCEEFTGQALIARPVSEAVPASGEWLRLARRPVRAIEAVSLYPFDGAVTVLAADAFAIDIDSSGDGWVRAPGARQGTRLRVDYEAGMASDWNGVPEALRQGVVRLVAHLHAHRDSVDDAGPPAAVAALWRPYRRMRLT